MSTRCRIGIQNKDGSVISIYCHFNGYVKGGVGERLFKYYKDEDTVRKLLSLGDISSLGTTPIENPNAWVIDDWFEKFHPDNLCDCYRTRGDENWEAQTDDCLKAYQPRVSNSWGDYGYFYTDGTWYVFESWDASTVHKVEDELASN